MQCRSFAIPPHTVDAHNKAIWITATSYRFGNPLNESPAVESIFILRIDRLVGIVQVVFIGQCHKIAVLSYSANEYSSIHATTFLINSADSNLARFTAFDTG
jgi:hypothetical protein